MAVVARHCRSNCSFEGLGHLTEASQSDWITGQMIKRDAVKEALDKRSGHFGLMMRRKRTPRMLHPTLPVAKPEAHIVDGEFPRRWQRQNRCVLVGFAFAPFVLPDVE